MAPLHLEEARDYCPKCGTNIFVRAVVDGSGNGHVPGGHSSRVIVLPPVKNPGSEEPYLPENVRLECRLLLKSRVDQTTSLISARVQKLPFRIGRADLDHLDAGQNDFAIPDVRPFFVSRTHCEIDYTPAGYLVRDLGSRLGTIVNGTEIGRKAGSKAALLEYGENIILLGGPQSPVQIVLTLARP